MTIISYKTGCRVYVMPLDTRNLISAAIGGNFLDGFVEWTSCPEFITHDFREVELLKRLGIELSDEIMN